MEESWCKAMHRTLLLSEKSIVQHVSSNLDFINNHSQEIHYFAFMIDVSLRMAIILEV